MIVQKITNILSSGAGNGEELDLTTFKVMLVVDTDIKNQYINAVFATDDAFLAFRETGEYDQILALNTDGGARKTIQGVIKERNAFFDRSWKDVAMQILYLLEAMQSVRQSASLKDDRDLQEYFLTMDKSVNLAQKLRNHHVV